MGGCVNTFAKLDTLDSDRQLQLVWWRLAGPFLERVHDVHRFRERGDVEYAAFELRLNPDLSSRISQWPRLGGVLNYCTRPA